VMESIIDKITATLKMLNLKNFIPLSPIL